jgi:heme/copper-type cytochrome/quinol oxidase subunit 3
VTAASVLDNAPAHGSLTRPNMVSIGTIVWLSSELMFFASLFAMYFTIRSVPGAEVYLTTGFHGLHVIGGLFAFVIVLMRSTVGRFTPEKATSAIVVSYYWHFVDVVWIGLFATIYIVR